MPPFKEDQILVIAPGSQTTLAQLGIPESLTPAAHHVRSCMFAAEKEGEYEPRVIRRKPSKKPTPNETSNEPDVATDAPKADTTNGISESASKLQVPAKTESEEVEYEEDPQSETGAIWPMKQGQIVDWPCFYALMTHVYNIINPPFHTPILLIAQPVWTPRDYEKLTQFFFEKFKIPAFVVMDAAMATSYAYRLPHATIVDVGLDKADVTAINDHLIHSTGRILALPDCGGSSMTETLLKKLSNLNFTRDMCEQLKKSPICEILLPTDELPSLNAAAMNPAVAATTGANAPSTVRTTTTEPAESTTGLAEDNEGVLDIASIVTSGNMNKFLEEKEREKAEKAAAKAQRKVDGAVAGAAAKPAKVVNAKRHKNTFSYQDHALESALKDMNVDGQGVSDIQNAMNVDAGHAVNGASSNGSMSREIEVGLERFQAADDGILDRLADAIHRTISAVEEIPRRSDLWNSIVIVGNGAKIKGFKEALIAHLQAKYLISPSSATMFTSEIPSNMSTPIATGMNTPQPAHMLTPGMLPHGGGGSGVNPMLLAATTGQSAMASYAGSPGPGVSSGTAGTPTGGALQTTSSSLSSTSHSQTPTSIDVAKIPEYFPEWKEFGYEEAMFLGAQVAVKVIFSGGDVKSYMTRTDYNEQGPQAIHDFGL